MNRTEFPVKPVAALAALALAPSLAWAQADASVGDDVEEIIVTGSYIKGTPEDAPNPISLITREDLLDQGSPNIVEIVKSIGISSGVDGETNQFQSNGQEGAANINLRGLGPGRTLVLLNGKRMTYSGVSVTQAGYQQYVNINNIPVLALQRIEMLRDGASATYGSDAVAGVANFLTRDTFEGVEISFNHRMVSDSDGWNEVGVVWGANFGDKSHLLLAFGYNTRSELELRSRAWAIPAYAGAENLFNGWSGTGNPGRFSLSGIAAHTDLGSDPTRSVLDPACVGGFGGLETSTGCRFQYTQYDNIIEDEARYQLYAEWDTAFAGGSTLEISGLIANIDVPEWKTSPSYPPNSTSRNLVRSDHPGFVQFVRDVNAGLYPDAWCSSTVAGQTGKNFWRPKGTAACSTTLPDPTEGNSVAYAGYYIDPGSNANSTEDDTVKYGQYYRNYPDGGSLAAATTAEADAVVQFRGRYLGWGATGPQVGTRTYDTMNFTYDYSFVMGDDIDVSIQGGYGSQTTDIVGADMLIQRYVLALNGYGGAGCVTNDAQVTAITDGDASTSPQGVTAGTGNCKYYNPFSNALRRAYRGTGTYVNQDNPRYKEGLANDQDLLNWLWAPTPISLETTLLTSEAIFSGNFGDHGWAAGAQLRLETYDGSYGGFNDFSAYPCESEFKRAGANCGGAGRDLGVYAFLAPGTPFSRDETVIAGFGEVALDFGALTVQAAARFESYSEAGVSSLVPKVSVRWDVLDSLTLRGSFGQSFKAPQLAQLGLNNATSLSFIPAALTFKAVDTTTAPGGLDPESSTNLNMGLVFQTGGLFLSFDLWQADLSDPILTESHTAVVDAVCPLRACNPNHALANRLNVDGDVLSSDTRKAAHTAAGTTLSALLLERIRVFLINGDKLSTGGHDFSVRYNFADWTNPMTLGMEWSHLATYELTARLDGMNVSTADHVGQLNAGDAAVRPLPADKYRLFWNMDIGNLRLGAQYQMVGDYTDERTSFAGLVPVPARTIDAYATLHFNATYKLNNDKTRVFVNIDNLADETPPYARTDLAYDAYTHSPLGQTLKLGFVHKF